MSTHLVDPAQMRANVREYVDQFVDEFEDVCTRVLGTNNLSHRTVVNTQYFQTGVSGELGGTSLVRVKFLKASGMIDRPSVQFNLSFSNHFYESQTWTQFWEFQRKETFRRMYEELQMLDVISAYNRLVRAHDSVQIGNRPTSILDNIKPTFKGSTSDLFFDDRLPS